MYYILTSTTCVLSLHYKSWFLHAAYIGTTIMRSIKHILFHHTAVPPQIDDRDVNETSRNFKIFGSNYSLLSLSYWRIYKDTIPKGMGFYSILIKVIQLYCYTGCCKMSVKLCKPFCDTFLGIILLFLCSFDCQIWAIFHFGTLWL